MKIEQCIYSNHKWEIISTQFENDNQPQLVFVFGSVALLKETTILNDIKKKYPNAVLTGCSTAGEIGKTFVKDDTIVTTAIFFEKTTIHFSIQEIVNVEDSFSVGQKLISSLLKDNLQHVFIFSEGLNINGSQFVNGCQDAITNNVSISGGLAADADQFKETYIVLPNGDVKRNNVVAIGFYGSDLKIGCGSVGGWDIFGIDRLVTKSKDNILFEIDNEPALSLYKSFLGEKSKDLPASALLFPLGIRVNESEEPIVRTILAINEEDQSMTFAGDIPQGSFVRLMKSDMNRLIDGAVDAAKNSLINIKNTEPEFALLVSCVGRKLVLKQVVEEEIDGVQEMVGDNTMITGFYSYGEISPFSFSQKCTLHNQTMTVTTFSEK